MAATPVTASVVTAAAAAGQHVVKWERIESQPNVIICTVVASSKNISVCMLIKLN